MTPERRGMDALDIPWLAGYIRSDRYRRLQRSPDCIKWRNMLIACCGTYLLVCILLTTALYAARRAITVLLFNAMQGVLVLAGAGVCAVRVYFIGMMAVLGCYSAVSGIILLYALLIAAVQGDGAFFLLHGSMIAAMDGPLLGVWVKTCFVFYKQWHLAEGPASLASMRMNPYNMAAPAATIIIQQEQQGGFGGGVPFHGGPAVVMTATRTGEGIAPGAYHNNVGTSSTNSATSLQQVRVLPGGEPPRLSTKERVAIGSDGSIIGMPAGQRSESSIITVVEMMMGAGSSADIVTGASGGPHQRPPPAAVATAAQTTNLPGSPLAASVVRGVDDILCPICLTNRRNVAIVPCGHLLCTTCAPKMMAPGGRASGVECPVCRTRVQAFQKLFL
ncbi:unnamed protein product [Amoebophrya sp. A25]|nr:unnamed protein product [Amoebophrya sp. A25]|eukprot:GSA25T00019557001.1